MGQINKTEPVQNFDALTVVLETGVEHGTECGLSALGIQVYQEPPRISPLQDFFN